MAYDKYYENDTFLFDSDIRVRDYNGLMDFLISQPDSRVKSHYNLLEGLAEFVTSDEDGSFGDAYFSWDGFPDKMFLCCSCDGYDEDNWKTLTPYLSGYIEWHTEDGNMWRDVFDEGAFRQETPGWNMNSSKEGETTCASCGKKIRTVKVDFFASDGSDRQEEIPLQKKDGRFYINYNPEFLEWTAFDFDNNEQTDTIHCPKCGKYPFRNKKINSYSTVTIQF